MARSADLTGTFRIEAEVVVQDEAQLRQKTLDPLAEPRLNAEADWFRSHSQASPPRRLKSGSSRRATYRTR